MPTILGFFVALAVVAWGTRWYVAHTPRDWAALLRRPSPSRPVEAPPLVSREAAEQLMQRAPASDPAPPLVVDAVAEASAPPRRGSKGEERWVPIYVAPARSDVLPEIVIDAPPTDAPTEPEGATVEGESVGAGGAVEVVEAGEGGALEVAAAAQAGGQQVIGFCARCRDKRPVLEPTRTKTKKGKPAIRGQCAECGAGMFVFVSDS